MRGCNTKRLRESGYVTDLDYPEHGIRTVGGIVRFDRWLELEQARLAGKGIASEIVRRKSGTMGLRRLGKGRL
ncbi:MAG: hypothetical protein Q7Q73_02565 [Verrucomicrobiota bacterium JB024]|nr:hypothetical protein [Verrucomicrobiota bacterium JB024]